MILARSARACDDFRSASAELLVLGSAYRAGQSVGQALPTMGPVARACLHGAACPVVVVAPCDGADSPSEPVTKSNESGDSHDGAPTGHLACMAGGHPEALTRRRQKIPAELFEALFWQVAGPIAPTPEAPGMTWTAPDVNPIRIAEAPDHAGRVGAAHECDPEQAVSYGQCTPTGQRESFRSLVMGPRGNSDRAKSRPSKSCSEEITSGEP